MIDTEKNSLSELRGRNPFSVPEGFFKDFTDDFMRRLPQKTGSEARVVSLYDRIKPWLYLAAMFVGMIVLFNVYHITFGEPKENVDAVLSSMNVDSAEFDDTDFYDYIEEINIDQNAFAYMLDDYYD